MTVPPSVLLALILARPVPQAGRPFSEAATAGAFPGLAADVACTAVWADPFEPVPGEAFLLRASFLCTGGSCPGGSACLFIDSNTDSMPAPGEIFATLDLTGMLDGEIDTLEAAMTLDQGWFPAAALACAEGDVVGTNDLAVIAISPGGGIPAIVSEAMANPLDEDTGEYLEIAYAGPGLFPLGECRFTDGDALDSIIPWQGPFASDPDAVVSQWLPGGHAAVVLDAEYALGAQPYDLPESTFAFTTPNTTLGNGLTTTDPIVLYGPSGTAWADVSSTYGTPLASDDPLLCDDDGLDGIPLDPGNGFSVERVSLSGPDAEYNWQVSAQGGSPGIVPQPADSLSVSACWVCVSPEHPAAGEIFAVQAAFLNSGCAQLQGTDGIIFLDGNADSIPQPAEILLELCLDGLQPGQTDTIGAACTLGDGFWLSGGFADCPGDADPSDNVVLHSFGVGEAPGPVITEVCANPLDEDCDEFFEVIFPGPGVYDLDGCQFTDGDAVDVLQPWDCASGLPDDPDAVPGRFLTAGGYAVILDPEYVNGMQPYDFAPGTVVLTPANTTLGDGLSCTDPLVLYSGDGATSGFILSTWGTPVISDNPLLCDDDGLDGIPFDPGQGMSVHRIAPGLSDSEGNWSAGEPTPGGPPAGLQPGIDFAVSGLELEPPLGVGGGLVEVRVCVSNCGTDTVPAGGLDLLVYADADLSGSPGPGETIISANPEIPQPGDTVQTIGQWASSPSGMLIRAWISSASDTLGVDDTLSTAWNRPFDVVINEVMYSPAPGEPEWLELVNSSVDIVDLSQWWLSDSNTATPLCSESLLLEAGVFAVVAADSSAFREAWPGVQCAVLQPADWPTLNDQTQEGEEWADDLRLSLECGQVCDRVPYDDSWGGGDGTSLEKINPALSGYLQAGWSPCSCLGTPGAPNSVFSDGGSGGGFLEFHPDPFSPDGDGVDDFLTVDLNLPGQSGEVTLEVYNVQGRLVRTLLDSEQCGQHLAATWDGTGDGGRRLAIGRYILYARAAPATGDVKEATAVVVLARRL